MPVKKSRRKKAKIDDGQECLSLIEPLLLSENTKYSEELQELAFELQKQASALKHSLPNAIVKPLSDLVRSANCYYSNLIEDRNTHPIDIDRALNEDYDKEPKKRNLQKEAKAHIEVQKWIDHGGLENQINTKQGLLEIHRRFYEQLPDELRFVKNPKTGRKIRITPGKIRHVDVIVGNHLPISASATPRFLERFEDVYSNPKPHKSVLITPAAHHRLLWIHPFPDGNGRVARLMSHAALMYAMDTGGIWSIARGLARKKNDYINLLEACDAQRRNDLDGRGNLSTEELIKFTRFFLEACIDQIDFMSTLMKPDKLHDRIMRWAQDEEAAKRLPTRSSKFLQALLYRGQIPRSEVQSILDVAKTRSTQIVGQLRKAGAITSAHQRDPWSLELSAKLAPIWVPGIYP